MKEIFKAIPGYEDEYEVSNLGRVKSFKSINPKILKPRPERNGYLSVLLSQDGNTKGFKIHQLVLMAFCNHVPNGMELVINHKNFIKTDNSLENIEMVTQRENSNKKHIESTSKYTGVYWNKRQKKWHSRISTKQVSKHLGFFTSEVEAFLAYQNELESI